MDSYDPFSDPFSDPFTDSTYDPFTDPFTDSTYDPFDATFDATYTFEPDDSVYAFDSGTQAALDFMEPINQQNATLAEGANALIDGEELSPELAAEMERIARCAAGSSTSLGILDAADELHQSALDDMARQDALASLWDARIEASVEEVRAQALIDDTNSMLPPGKRV